jgi:hypothetical protein
MAEFFGHLSGSQRNGRRYISTEHIFGASRWRAGRKILEENNISREKVSKIMKEVRRPENDSPTPEGNTRCWKNTRQLDERGRHGLTR